MAAQNFHDKVDLPDFDAIPSLEGLPKGCTWGFWDKDGRKDELGTLNILTPEVVKRAATEIKEGLSVSLNWELNKPKTPVFHRQPFLHKIIDNSTFSQSASFDDELSFNTQSGSQWDGLRHVVHRQAGALYNGVKKQEIIGPNASTVLGLDKWHKRGGVVGRGVLIDYVSYAQRHKIEYAANGYHGIKHTELEEAALEQGVAFETGDVLIVRSGVTKWYNECEAEREAFLTSANKASVGLDPTPEAIAWIWNHHFSAVAGDALAFEAVPYPTDRPSFHNYALALWGTPIGELWDLEALSETCKRLGRYSFFFTSIPLNVPGGVASPPNALAIF